MKDAKTMGGEAAFPVLAFVNKHGNVSDPQFGLTRREYFAGLASDPPAWWIANVLNTSAIPPCGGMEYAQAVASWKVMQADALLSALAKESDQ